MRFLAVLILVTNLYVPVLADTSPSEHHETWIQTILEEYSERTGAKFVLDPRVNMKAQLIGFESGEIDYPTLTRILLVHGYKSVKIDDVIYVLVDTTTDEFIEKLSETIDN